MVFMRRFPPINPPLRPIEAIYSERFTGAATGGLVLLARHSSIALQSILQAGLDHADVCPCRWSRGLTLFLGVALYLRYLLF
jgi:hypothetical protein